MMTVIARKDRVLDMSRMLSCLKATGDAKISLVGKYCKWAECPMGRYQRTVNVYSLITSDGHWYLFSVDLKYAGNALTLTEMQEWLKDHKFKTEKAWHIEDCGMSEETWAIWNSGEEA